MGRRDESNLCALMNQKDDQNRDEQGQGAPCKRTARQNGNCNANGLTDELPNADEEAALPYRARKETSKPEAMT